MAEMPIALLDWKKMDRNSLKGFAKVRLGKFLIVCDVALHCANGRRWAQLPAKPMVGKDGLAIKDDRGKIKYVPMMEWADRATSESFNEGVIAAVEREYPGDTGN